MKVKVLKKFKDKHTKAIHKANDVIDISQERFDEILKTDLFVEKVEELNEGTAEEPELEKADDETEKETVAPAQNKETKEEKKNSTKTTAKRKMTKKSEE